MHIVLYIYDPHVVYILYSCENKVFVLYCIDQQAHNYAGLYQSEQPYPE